MSCKKPQAQSRGNDSKCCTWISGFGKNDLFKYTLMKGIIKKECAMFRFYPKSKRYL